MYGWLTLMSIDRMPNAQVRELCGVNNGVDEKTEESFLRWFAHIKRMENSRSPIKVNEVEYIGSRPGFNVEQVGRMMHETEMRERVYGGEGLGLTQGMNP